MFKSSVFVALAFLLCATATANANKLDPKWTDARAISNQLGDAVKAGDRASFAPLKAKADEGDATAMHNMGWLEDNGYPDHAVDNARACGWYKQGAMLGYPPSMHGHALCLFKRSRGPGSEDQAEIDAIQFMRDAAKDGWTGSALYLSEYILNLPLLAEVDADKARIIIGWGYRSDPNDAEKVALSYMEGVAMVFGTEGKDYQAGVDALSFAERRGHSAAGQALEQLYARWAGYHIKQMAAWTLPAKTGLQCYREREHSADDKLTASLECGQLDKNAENALERLTRTADKLRYEVAGQTQTDLVAAINDLKARSESFRSDRRQLLEIFSEVMMSGGN